MPLILGSRTFLFRGRVILALTPFMTLLLSAAFWRIPHYKLGCFTMEDHMRILRFTVRQGGHRPDLDIDLLIVAIIQYTCKSASSLPAHCIVPMFTQYLAICSTLLWSHLSHDDRISWTAVSDCRESFVGFEPSFSGLWVLLSISPCWSPIFIEWSVVY